MAEVRAYKNWCANIVSHYGWSRELVKVPECHAYIVAFCFAQMITYSLLVKLTFCVEVDDGGDLFRLLEAYV